jgi:hypothetical protein
MEQSCSRGPCHIICILVGSIIGSSAALTQWRLCCNSNAQCGSQTSAGFHYSLVTICRSSFTGTPGFQCVSTAHHKAVTALGADCSSFGTYRTFVTSSVQSMACSVASQIGQPLVSKRPLTFILLQIPIKQNKT